MGGLGNVLNASDFLNSFPFWNIAIFDGVFEKLGANDRKFLNLIH